jgi:hypothetical protein
MWARTQSRFQFDIIVTPRMKTMFGGATNRMLQNEKAKNAKQGGEKLRI